MKQIPKPPVAMKTARKWLAVVHACSEYESDSNFLSNHPLSASGNYLDQLFRLVFLGVGHGHAMTKATFPFRRLHC